MHTVFALPCFVVVIHWLISPYPSGLLHWHCGNLTIAPVPAKQPWWIWINTSCEFIMNDCITTTKQSTTKPCAYFLGYTVYLPCPSPCWPRAPAARHRVTWPWGPYWLFLPNSDPVGTPVSSKISPNVETDELVTRKVPHFRWDFLITGTAKLPATRVFVQQLVRANIRENINAQHYWSFVRGIYRWPVDSPQKGPVIRTLSWRQYEWEGGGGGGLLWSIDMIMIYDSRYHLKQAANIGNTLIFDGLRTGEQNFFFAKSFPQNSRFDNLQ